jgi:hypothetical protein
MATMQPCSHGWPLGLIQKGLVYPNRHQKEAPTLALSDLANR